MEKLSKKIDDLVEEYFEDFEKCVLKVSINCRVATFSSLWSSLIQLHLASIKLIMFAGTQKCSLICLL